MKASIIRRMDELGRVVIPKEIRKKLRIREGDRIEIAMNENQQIILQKHDLDLELVVSFESVASSLHQKVKNTIIICSMEKVLATSGGIGKNYPQRVVTDKFLDKLEGRETTGEFIEVVKGEQLNYPYALIPLGIYGETYGGIIIIGDVKKIEPLDVSIAEATSFILSSHME